MSDQAKLALATDLFVPWLFPEAHNFVMVSLRYTGLSSGLAFDHSTAHATKDLTGVARWFLKQMQFGLIWKPLATSKVSLYQIAT